MVLFPTDPVFVDDVTVVVADQMNDAYRNALLNLKAGHGSPPVTVRDVLLLASSFESLEGAPEIRHEYETAAAGSVLRFVASCLGPDGPQVGDRLRVDLMVGNAAGETRIGAYFELLMTSAGGASLILNTMKASPFAPGLQVPNDPPAVRIDEGGRVFLGKSTGTAALNVGGNARAARFYRLGLEIGVWTLSGRTMQYDGDAEAQVLIGGAENGEGLSVASSVLNQHLTAELMAGYTWSSDTTMKVVRTVWLPVPGDEALEYIPALVFPPCPRPGTWHFWAELTSPDGCYMRVPGGWTGLQPHPFSAGSVGTGHRPQVKGIGVAGLALEEEAVIGVASNSEHGTTCTGSAVGIWCSPHVGILLTPIRWRWRSEPLSVFVTPGQVQDLAAVPGASEELDLTWDALAGAVTYTLYRAPTSGGTFVEVEDLIAGAAYTDTGLTNGTTYYYVVEAVNPSGVGPASDEASGTPSVPIPAGNLVLNPSNELGLAGGVPNSWTTSTPTFAFLQYDGSGPGDASPPDGSYWFAADNAANASALTTTLTQSIDLSGSPAEIDTGLLDFDWSYSYMTKSGASAACRVFIYSKTTPSAGFVLQHDSGLVNSDGAVTTDTGSFTMPVGARYIQINLQFLLDGGLVDCTGRYDNVVIQKA